MTETTKVQDFEQVFHQYKGWVYKTAYLITGDHQKAEDVMQEVFISAYKFSNTYDASKGSYTNWLRRITVNQCTRSSRRKILPSSSIEEMQDNGHGISDNSMPVDEQVLLTDQISRLLKSLDNKYRAVLILRFYEDLSYAEIGDILHIPLGTVKSRIHMAISTLQNGHQTTEQKETTYHELR
ncbi:MAG: RNA polymerase sigma factor [Chloroflexi bacterium]|nr:RNA polymerase sigma factor [Chloroflexota bacterium]MBT7080777.1 RNA polymerase sigma factor [Chloroflexota bacterium]MBT7289727.1 RNA polymerase sigma factor [Chloroflexota bacterium]